jgi:hypothetical protein
MWILHWALQGLKLWLFAAVASMVAFLACLPFGIIESALKKFLEPSQFTSVTAFIAAGLGLVVALAVGTATLASMLNDHPLLPFNRKQPRPVKPEQAEQGVTPNA